MVKFFLNPVSFRIYGERFNKVVIARREATCLPQAGVAISMRLLHGVYPERGKNFASLRMTKSELKIAMVKTLSHSLSVELCYLKTSSKTLRCSFAAFSQLKSFALSRPFLIRFCLIASSISTLCTPSAMLSTS